MNQPFPVPGYPQPTGYAGPGPVPPTTAGGVYGQDAAPVAYGLGQPPAAQGVMSLVGLTLHYLDELNTLAGRTLEQTPAPEMRQALWQVQQLANQARSCSYQIRGMLLQ